MKPKIQNLLLALALLSTLNLQLSTAHAQGSAFTYQGRLNDGANPARGVFDFRTILYTSDVGGNQTGPILTNNAVPISGGLFTISLNFGPTVFGGPIYWLEMAVRTNGDGAFVPLNPRQQLTPSPYAIMAGSAANLLGSLPAVQLSGPVPSANLAGTYDAAVTFNNAANAFRGSFAGNGANVTNVDAATLNGLSSSGFWQTSGNSGTTPGTSFIGTSDNQALELHVNGARALRIEPNQNGVPNVIGGAANNAAGAGVSGVFIGSGSANTNQSGGSVLGGGFANLIETNTHHSVIAGGEVNTISHGSDRSTIAGGHGNIIQTNSTGSVIGGGIANYIGSNNRSATIAGGTNNVVQDSAILSTISGGRENFAGDIFATVGGGRENISRGAYSTVGGGNGNAAGGIAASISGGYLNICDGSYATVNGGVFNTCSNSYSTVGGGQRNFSGGTLATVGGGGNNTSSGLYSTIPGGAENTATADYSFAAGNRAKADNQGSFVWADSSAFDFHSALANQFAVRCTGGAKFVTAIDNTGAQTAGVRLQAGDTAWSSISDRNAKKNFQPVDAEAVLEKLTALPVQSWNYKWESDTNTPHLGPMAQDFKAAFYPGRDDKSISTLEFDGVELAAIQGLNQKLTDELKRRDAENAELKTQNQSLEKRLEALEKIILDRKPD
jgi:hypothetical protein